MTRKEWKEYKRAGRCDIFWVRPTQIYVGILVVILCIAGGIISTYCYSSDEPVLDKRDELWVLSREQQIQLMIECIKDANKARNATKLKNPMSKWQTIPDVHIAIAFFEYRIYNYE